MTQEYIDICGDGGCLKKITQESTYVEVEGEELTPPIGSEVTVHYTGTLEDGSKFDSSRDRNDPFKFKLGQGQVIKGWDKGVATMKRGERATFKLRSDYAYGDSGSPPKIPGGATLVFDVELLDWDSWQTIHVNKYPSKALQKQIVKESSDDEQPAFGGAVKVNYTASLNRTVVDSKTNLEFVIGNESVPNVIERAVKTMKTGERAKFKVTAAVAPKEYNAKENETVLLDVELLSVQNIKNSWDMETEEKFLFFEKRKEEGNKYFKAGNFKQAAKRYKRALTYVDTNFEKDEDKNTAKKHKIVAYLNLAATQIKLKKYKEAIKNADNALKEDSNNLKAYFRRAQARINLVEYDQAKEDLNKALSIDSNSKEVKDELAKLNDLIKKQNQKDKKLYSAMFSAIGDE